MAIKINLETTIIPVEIGNFKFEIEMTDEKEKTFQIKLNDFLEQIQVLEDTVEDELKLREMMETVYDDLLGIGTFGKLYEFAPSIGILSGVLIQLIEEIGKETQSRITTKPILKAINKKATKKPVAKNSVKK